MKVDDAPEDLAYSVSCEGLTLVQGDERKRLICEKGGDGRVYFSGLFMKKEGSPKSVTLTLTPSKKIALSGVAVMDYADVEIKLVVTEPSPSPSTRKSKYKWDG